MRKPQSRRAYTKNKDAQIACLGHRVLHNRVIKDARPGTSLISIYWRRVKSERVSDYKTHPRCTLTVHVTDFILGWGPYGTNMRRMQGHTCPITKKFEIRFILARHQFNCRLVVTVALIGDAPY
jgi:hypothetical protein